MTLMPLVDADADSSTEMHEYCEDETFTATCSDHQVVIMQSARYQLYHAQL